MKHIIHRYIRRAVVWAQSPSDEELLQRELDAKAARRNRLARNVRNALLSEKRYAEWMGLGAEDAANLIEDIRAIGAADPLISQGSVDRLVTYLRPCTYLAPSSAEENAA